jgi:cytochrome c nitrite reductase small subunit
VLSLQGTALAALLGTALGAAVGIGGYTFVYAKGASYLKDDPAACANCHVMWDQYDGWRKSSHHAVATCNDCHTPHNLAGKYAVKAMNGFWHSFYFTTGTYPDPIRITERNRTVTEHACRYCHAEITEAIDHGPGTVSGSPRRAGGDALQVSSPRPVARAGEPISCIRCHKYVGHWVR